MNDLVFEVPKGVVTETCRMPVAAPALMVTVAATCDALTITMLVVMPSAGLKFTDVACDRFVPVIVSVNVVPRAFLEGDMVLMAGAGEEEEIPNIKELVEVPPLAVVTVTNRAETAAAAPMLTEHVTWLAVELMLLIVTPSGGLKLTEVAPARLLPLMVSVNDAP